ncbi:aldose 1-epimerase family protein [Ancylobacter sp. 6x-1]|uniref:Aldose 1-epimerase family protein n=1 Tax=Ancylobacter crimeensis TaxID=2579147 RepID=A0ABT0DA03_9HYPH|nr:aldose 1-epimerase family protein [Ancylobacter crimeensis]MCK0196784.1 aldose 1-epimerase family protein [Ancylobacter crimeensis]
MSEKPVVLKSEHLTAEIAPLGAELQRLTDADGRDLLWDGGAAWWTGRAPLLFPIVGRLPDDALVHDGVSYPMKQHGFARRRAFTLLSATASRAIYRLTEDEETLKQYPFPFGLYISYTLLDATLAIEARVHNPGTARLPVSFGFHPAFRWPLPYGGTPEEHTIRFEKPEVAPIHRPVDGLLSRYTEPSPAMGGGITLDDPALFERDALIFDQIRSHHVRYGVPGQPGLEIAFAGMPQFALWSKPGAPFICLEPWFGYATPEGDTRPFAEKPGLIQVQPGNEVRFAMQVRWLPDVGRDIGP